MAKKNLMITVEEDLIKQAKELGLNISKICENALKLYIQRLQGINNEIISNSSTSQQNKTENKEGIGTVGSDWCGRRDLNPGPQRGRLTS